MLPPAHFAFTQDDLRWLVCPVCLGALALEAEPTPATIRCASCARRYPIVDGIPVLLPNRAS